MELKIVYRLNDEVKSYRKKCDDLMIDHENLNGHEIYTIKAFKSVILERALIRFAHVFADDDLLFANGYESWTETKEYLPYEKLKNIRWHSKALVDKFALDKYGDVHFKKYHGDVIHGYDMGYVKGNDPLYIASYNYQNAYLIINMNAKEQTITLESDIKGYHLNEGESLCLFDYEMSKDESAFEHLFASLNVKNSPKLLGYTSWYNYYQNINKKIIEENLESIGAPYDLFQIDDGYETFVGDWKDIDSAKFPSGLSSIVTKIHDKGLKAGIWLAPFAAEEKSEAFRNHPEWFKDGYGNIIKCGHNWSGFYGMNIYNEDVRNYIKSCLNFYKKLGFDFFKLDFVYAASVLNYPNKTRAMVADDAYSFLRENLEGKIILGCGAILSNSYGNFDYLRIGPDVSLDFDDQPMMRMLHRERNSTKVTLQNTIYRSFYNGKAFGCDPDVFLLRDDNTKLTKKQKEAMIIIDALFGNVLMTSDNIVKYDNEQKALFDYAFDVYKHAVNITYKRKQDLIFIQYELNGIKTDKIYDVNKGEFING